MRERIGDLHLRVVLAGEPASVRLACNERFVPYMERATVRHHWRLRFARSPDHASSGTVDLGRIARDTRVGADSALSRVGDQMEACDVAYARRLIDKVHRAIADRATLEPFGEPHPRFWLAIEVECHAADLLDALAKTTRIATVWDYEASIYVREGGQRPVLRSLTGARSIKTLAPEDLTPAVRLLNEMSGVMARANRAREAVVQAKARAVLQDLAEDWLANGSIASYTPWRSFVGGNDHWLDMVELDFLEANLERYRELHKQRSQQEADCKPEMRGAPLSRPGRDWISGGHAAP